MEDELEYLVSNHDIENKFNHSKNVIVMIYSQLKNVTSIFDVLKKPLSACFILLRTSDNGGHWTVLVRNKNNIYYFDSYGIKPDGEFRNIPLYQQLELDENQRYLTNLINGIPSDYTFTYNNMQLQQYKNNVNTCGKWTTVFTKCIFYGLSMEEFQSRFKMLKKKYKTSYDILICVLWDAF